MFGGNKSTGIANQPSLSSLTEQPCQVRIGNPKLVFHHLLQLATNSLDNSKWTFLPDPLSQNLFHGQDEDAVPILEGESGTQDGQGNPPVIDEAVEEDDGDEGNCTTQRS